MSSGPTLTFLSSIQQSASNDLSFFLESISMGIFQVVTLFLNLVLTNTLFSMMELLRAEISTYFAFIDNHPENFRSLCIFIQAQILPSHEPPDNSSFHFSKCEMVFTA